MKARALSSVGLFSSSGSEPRILLGAIGDGGISEMEPILDIPLFLDISRPLWPFVA